MIPAALLDHVRSIAMKMPAATEKTSHGQPTFFIEKGKIFCWFLHDSHNPGVETAIAVKADGEEQAMLIDRDPDRFFRPAYLAPRGWIGIRLDDGPVDWDYIAGKIEESWERVAPAKLLKARA